VVIVFVVLMGCGKSGCLVRVFSGWRREPSGYSLESEGLKQQTNWRPSQEMSFKMNWIIFAFCWNDGAIEGFCLRV